MRLQRDWWLAFTLVPLGLLSWASFLYAGGRANRPLWFGFGGLYLTLTVVGVVLCTIAEGTPSEATYDDIGAITILTTWLGSLAHAVSIRPVLYGQLQVREAAQAAQIETDAARDLARDDPGLARTLGVGRPDLPGAEHFGLIDVNHVPPDVLARLPGLDDRTLAQVVELRPFSSVEDLGSALELPPQVVDELRLKAVFVGR